VQDKMKNKVTKYVKNYERKDKDEEGKKEE
jgi:hypothetical protein